MAKNIEINYNTGLSYETLYPKTLASLVGAGTFSGTFGFSGAVSFTSLPTSSATPTATNQLTTKTYVDSAIANNSSSVPQYNVLVDATTVTLTGGTTRAYFTVPTGYEIAAFSVQDVSGASEVSDLYNPINVCWKDVDSQSGIYYYRNTLQLGNTSARVYVSGTAIVLTQNFGAAGRIIEVIAFMRKTT